MTKLIAAAALLIGAVWLRPALAQQVSEGHGVPQPAPLKIFIGQPLSDAVAVLAARRIEAGEGGFALTQGDPDQSNLHFKLDENHTSVCASFSRSRQTITGLSMVFVPSRAAQAKLDRSWIPAVELTLYPDTSYAVHFAQPLTLEQLEAAEKNRPQSVYPR